MSRERRVKIYCIDERQIVFFFAQANRMNDCFFFELPTEHDSMPEDAEVIRVTHDFSRQCLLVMVWSASFDVVGEGEAAPFAAEPARLMDCATLKRRSIFETHEPATPEDAAKLAPMMQSWRDRNPLL